MNSKEAAVYLRITAIAFELSFTKTSHRHKRRINVQSQTSNKALNLKANMAKEYSKNEVKLLKLPFQFSEENRNVRKQKYRSGIKSLSEAKRVERELTFQAHSEIVNAENLNSTWGSLVDEWELALRAGSGSVRSIMSATQADYINILRNYTQEWCAIPADQISPADVRDVFVKIHELKKSQTRQTRVKTAIDGLFKWAIESRKVKNIFVSPAKGVSLIGRPDEKPPEILTLNEIRKLLKLAREMNHRWYPVWAMALLTGCRSGEMYALKWPDVDFENRRIMISKSFNKRTRTTGPTKAGYWREVPIGKELEHLQRLRLASAGNDWVLPHHGEWHRYQQASVLRQFCRDIGVPSIRFHALRACFATQLIKDGIAPSVVMKVCGWKDLKTMQRYIRMAGIEIEGATDTLKILPDDQVMGRVVDLLLTQNSCIYNLATVLRNILPLAG